MELFSGKFVNAVAELLESELVVFGVVPIKANVAIVGWALALYPLQTYTSNL